MSDDVFAWVRWVLSGAAAIILAVLSLAWKGLNMRVDTIHAAAASNTATAVLHAERITRTEERVLTHMQSDERIMDLLNQRLDRIEMKLDSALTRTS